MAGPNMVAASLFAILAACGCASPVSAGTCVFFQAAGVPFKACSRGGGSGFLLSAGGQRSVVAPRMYDHVGPHYWLSMNYERGDWTGAWMAKADFVVNLRWDTLGPRRNRLMAEFCGLNLVPVLLRSQHVSLRSCGDWMTVIEEPTSDQASHSCLTNNGQRGGCHQQVTSQHVTE